MHRVGVACTGADKLARFVATSAPRASPPPVPPSSPPPPSPCSLDGADSTALVRCRCCGLRARHVCCATANYVGYLLRRGRINNTALEDARVHCFDIRRTPPEKQPKQNRRKRDDNGADSIACLSNGMYTRRIILVASGWNPPRAKFADPT